MINITAAPTQVDFQFDFTASVGKLYLPKIVSMRNFIKARRPDREARRTLIYKAIVGSIQVQAVDQYVALAEFKGTTEQKLTRHSVKFPNSQNEIIMSISIDSIYPSMMGYAFYNGVSQECYQAWINGVFHTIVGITYDQYPNLTKVTDFVGILVAEQIRFNTLDILFANFPDAINVSADELFLLLFKNFKRAIYNDWRENWGEGKVQGEKQYQGPITFELTVNEQNLTPNASRVLQEKRIAILNEKMADVGQGREIEFYYSGNSVYVRVFKVIRKLNVTP